MKTRTSPITWLAIAFLLTCAGGTGPAWGQAFSDRAAPAWVAGAIEELVRDHVVSGPALDPRLALLLRERDGGITRAEVAAWLARALPVIAARLEAPGPTVGVSRSDLAAVQRLVHEFEAELASLDVLSDVLQRQVEGLGPQVRQVKVSGDARLRYELSRTALNNPGVGPIAPSGNEPFLNSTSMRVRLEFDGGLTDDTQFRLRLMTFNELGTTDGTFSIVNPAPTGQLNSMFIPFNSGQTTAMVQISMFEFDWSRAFGLPLEFRVGHLGGDTWLPRNGDPLYPMSPPSGRTTALQLGPIGLLLDTAKDVVGERSLGTYGVDALVATYRPDGFEGQFLLGGIGGVTFVGGRAQGAPVPGVTVGLNFLTDSCDPGGGVDNAELVSDLTILGAGKGVAQCSFVWWGAQNGWVPTANAGTTSPITNIPGTGYSADVDVILGSDVRLQSEVGWWYDPTAQTTGLGWQAQAIVGHSGGPAPVLVLGYQSFDSAFYPAYGAGEDPVVGFIWPGGFRDAFGIVEFPPVGGWTFSAGYENGTSLGVGPQPGAVGFGGPGFADAVCESCAANGQPFSGWLASAAHTIGQNATLRLYYFSWQFNGASQADSYRVEVDYQF
ncbi:MAG TPA: hypothetical protein VEP50_20290 [bacterium]|nr:hypothetical protein [bacterium]